MNFIFGDLNRFNWISIFVEAVAIGINLLNPILLENLGRNVFQLILVKMLVYELPYLFLGPPKRQF